MNTQSIQGWKKEFAKSWGATNLSQLSMATQLSVDWIDENVVTPLQNQIEGMKKDTDMWFEREKELTAEIERLKKIIWHWQQFIKETHIE